MKGGADRGCTDQLQTPLATLHKFGWADKFLTTRPTECATSMPAGYRGSQPGFDTIAQHRLTLDSDADNRLRPTNGKRQSRQAGRWMRPQTRRYAEQLAKDTRKLVMRMGLLRAHTARESRGR